MQRAIVLDAAAGGGFPSPDGLAFAAVELEPVPSGAVVLDRTRPEEVPR